jgi:predicted unusual protein kinase regulating ubiquinone biosynthesis (AarF/ABC1/UbiB family)
MNNEYTVVDRRRYRRILIFLASVIFHVFWWDLLLGRLPVLRTRVQRSRPERLRHLAGGFRLLAIEMGGVMIKLGQFLSSRVDVLPMEITQELQGLQDEVPPVDSDDIFALLRSELGELSQRFARIERQPLAAASLGQTHRAWLLPDNGSSTSGDALVGEAVVIKVQRPGIKRLVSTDLAALRVVARWVMRYRPIGRRADVPALVEEFAHTLWCELDYVAEADNARRFKVIHADNPHVYIPDVYREHSTNRVIVLEDVEALKIAEVERLVAAGIDPKEVAETLLEAYFKQIFIAEFFHADPHPGNLFVRPLGKAGEQGGEGAEERGRLEAGRQSEDGMRSGKGRPFQLIFVDFGMAVEVPKVMGENLRKFLVALTQRDARQWTEAGRDMGFFLPGADLDRITEAHEALLGRIWGRKLLELARPDPKEVAELSREFRDLLFDLPFQLPQDFIYLGRALGMISGLISKLDPQINPWYQIEHYGLELIRSQNARQLRDFTLDSALGMLRPYLETPARLQRLLDAAEKGQLRVQMRNDREMVRSQERLERRINQLGWSIVTAAGLVSATLLYLERRRNGNHREEG